MGRALSREDEHTQPRQLIVHTTWLPSKFLSDYIQVPACPAAVENELCNINTLLFVFLQLRLMWYTRLEDSIRLEVFPWLPSSISISISITNMVRSLWSQSSLGARTLPRTRVDRQGRTSLQTSKQIKQKAAVAHPLAWIDLLLILINHKTYIQYSDDKNQPGPERGTQNILRHTVLRQAHSLSRPSACTHTNKLSWPL